MGKWTTIAEAAIELLSKRKGGALPDTTLDSVPPKALPTDEASRMARRKQIDDLRAEANALRFDDSYRMQHTAPDAGSSPTGEDLSDVFPDIYGPMGKRYYGTSSPYDDEAISKIQTMRGNPDSEITIYRAVPKDVKEINPGDWVTTTKEYAVDHIGTDDGYTVISKKVKAGELANNGDSIHEFGFSPKALPTDEASRVKISDVSVSDAHGGEMFGYKELKQGGQPVAAADVNIYGDEVSIQNVVTRDGFRRKGLATKLIDDLFREFPDKKIRISNTTEDGSKFFPEKYDIDVDGFITKKLPSDEASRMARAQEFPVESYHGTRSEFGDFGGRGFGDHFGTPEQANMRLKNTRRERGDEGAERVLPVRLNIRSPLEMEDVGEWGSPAKVAEGLKKTPVGAKNSQALDEIIEEAEGLRPQFEDNDYFLASPEAEDLLDEMRRMVEAEGHDGIKYSNQVENTYGDRADLTPEAKKIKSGLEADLRKIQKTISDRDPAPPLGSDVATLQRWLDRPKIEPTTAEAAELERVNKALQYSNFETGDPNSYIVFDPSNVRSRFAQFDPAKAGSADILAGLGIVGAGAALSQQDGFDYGALSNVVEESNGQSSD